MDRLGATFLFLTVTGTSLVFGTLDCDTSCLTSNQFDLDITVVDSDIDLSWTFNQSKAIYGFQMIIYNDADDITYESPILHSSERSMSLQHELDGETNICLVVYENSTKIIDKKCDKIKKTDLKIVIGILAGTIFLIPCITGLIYIIYKDHRIRFMDQYKKLDLESETGSSNIEVVENVEEEKNNKKTDVKKPTVSDKAVDNKAFVIEDEVQQVPNVDQPVSEASTESIDISKREGSESENEISEDINSDKGETTGACPNEDCDQAKAEGNSDKIKFEGNSDMVKVEGNSDKVKDEGSGDKVKVEGNSDKIKVEGNSDKVKVEDESDNQEDEIKATVHQEDSDSVINIVKEETVSVSDEDVSGTAL